jgi:hypothetical protein
VTQACACAQQQNPGYPAADRGLRQRDIRCRETHPGQREQQPEGDKADNRGEGVTSRDGPHSHRDDQEGKTDIENQG